MNRVTASRGRTRAAAISVVCLLVAFTASAQPGPESVTSSAHLGYRLGGGKVTFTFDRSQYEAVTRGDSGERLPMAGIALAESSEVAVAGEFNGWATDAWKMELVEPGVYETSRPLDEFAEQDFWAFKFVIDRLLWVEPPASATNIVPTGLGNDSFNLLLMLAEPGGGRPPVSARATGPGEPGARMGDGAKPELAHVESPLLSSLTLLAPQLPGGCTLKLADKAMGMAPIPVDSNPMITSDSRVIGFASIFVMPPTPEEEAAWEAETSMLGPGAVMKRIEELIVERTSMVRAAYIAVYESSETGQEMGVFALEFSEPLSPERRAELEMGGRGGAVVASERVAAAVWTDDPGRLCFDAVLAHVRSVLGE